MLDPKGLAAAKEVRGFSTTEEIIRAYLEATGEAKPVCFIQSEVLAMLSTDKTATGTVCSGLLQAPFGNPVPLFAAPTVSEPVAWRWKAKGATIWIYDPDPEWLEEHRHEIDTEPLYAAPVPATSAQVAPDGKTKENGNHVSDSNLGEPLVDSRALDGRRVAVGADTLGDYGGDRLVHRPLAQSEQSSLVAGLPATDTARPLNSGQMKLPATKPYVDRLIRIFNDRPRNDTSAVVLLDYARAALSSAPSTSEGWR